MNEYNKKNNKKINNNSNNNEGYFNDIKEAHSKYSENRKKSLDEVEVIWVVAMMIAIIKLMKKLSKLKNNNIYKNK